MKLYFSEFINLILGIPIDRLPTSKSYVFSIGMEFIFENQDLREIYKGVQILEVIPFYQNALHLNRVNCTPFYQNAL